MSNQKNDQGRFDIVPIGHIKTPDSCLRKVKEGNYRFNLVKEGNHSRQFNAIFQAIVLQSLTGCATPNGLIEVS